MVFTPKTGFSRVLHFSSFANLSRFLQEKSTRKIISSKPGNWVIIQDGDYKLYCMYNGTIWKCYL